MKQVLIPLVLTMAFIVAVGLFSKRLGNNQLSFGSTTPTPYQESKDVVNIGDVVVEIELADNEEERKNGLSGKDSLEEGKGMLFTFNQKDISPPFWMRNMKFPIDIIWINDDKITDMDTNVQPPEADTPDSRLKLYYPDKPIDYVLEVTGGFSQKNDLKINDKVDFSQVSF